MNELIIFSANYLYLAIVIAAVVFVVRLPREERLRAILCALIALPLTYIVAKVAGAFYYDPRPFVAGNFTPLLAHAADNGFPSDHTLLSSAVAAVVFCFRRNLGLALFVIAFLVGAARVAAGIHHFIDIFGSMFIASAVTFVVFRCILPEVWRRMSERFTRN